LGGLGEGLQNKVEFISETNNRLQLHVIAREDAFLVLSDTYFPGWKAYVDDREEKIHRADYNFRAIFLRAGMHQVEFVYRPMSFTAGAIVTSLAIIGCLSIGLVVRYRGRSKRKT
jgi:uncharacterized membrane protein YfhO